MAPLHHISKHLRNVRYLVLTVCCLLSVKVHAQRYPFYNLNVENGLLQSQATCMTQDKFGNLWIGTLGGLSRYDGKNFTNYTVRNGLMNNEISSVATDTHGNIWIGTSGGVSEFNGKDFRHYPVKFAENTISRIPQLAICNDTVWFRAAGRIYFIAQDKTRPFHVPGSDNFITAILPEKGNFWIAAKSGVIYNFHNNKWDSLHFGTLTPEGKPPVVTKIYRDKESRLWVLTNAGLYNIENGNIAVHYLNDQPLNNLPGLYSITEDNTGAFWMGTPSGVIRLTNNTLQYYNKHNGLSDNGFNCTLTDAEGDVWLASDGQGIFRFSGTQFTELDESMGLASAQITALTADRGGRLFIGTYNGGLYTFQNDQVAPVAFPSNPVPLITAMCTTHDGKIWIGTHQGLWRYDNIFREYSFPEHHFPSNFVTALYSDTARRLWIGFINGAVVYANDTFKRVQMKGAPVISFITIGNDSVLIATENGIKLYNAGNVTDFRTNTATDSAFAQCFTLLGEELWIGTSDNGVICYNLKTQKSFVINKSNGLQSDFIYNIIADNEGNIWAGTGYGIHKISRKGNGAPLITFYGRTQGITGMESNQNAVFKMRDGGIWFGTTNGAIHYQPHSKIVSSQPVSIILENVTVFGEDITDTHYFDSTDNWHHVPYNLHLPYQKNNITFTFQAVTLSGQQQLLYRYRIDGLDAPWSNWSPTNAVTYSALPPGKYVFHVQCNTTTSGQKIQELTYPFEIITPLQQTPGFRFAILGACILLGIIIQYIANNRKQRRLRVLEKMRSEEQGKIRMRTAEDFHDEVGNKLTRINVLTNVLKNKLTSRTPDIDKILGQIEDNTAQLYSGTRDILWSLQPSNDNLYEILHRIRDFGGELFDGTDIDFLFIGTDEKWKNYRLPLDVSRNLIMIFKEALNNCLKYSKATTIKVEAHLKRKDVLQLRLIDNGVGFDIHNIKKGHGINNMNIRAARIHGRLYIDSRENKGTIISLTFKITPNR
jgi:ligand-binding sensor domain-containing protein/signal transduction histidine kinase